MHAYMRDEDLIIWPT